MTRPYLLVHMGLVALAVVGAPDRGRADTVFGPRAYVRTTGSPDTFAETLDVCRPERPFVLRVENGPGGAVKVASGTITLNGVEVVHPSDFGKQVDTIERPVALAPSNALGVQLAGTPQGTVRVAIQSEVPCAVELRITAPVEGAVVATGSLVVRGTVRPPLGIALSVNGLAALVNGTDWAAEIPVDAATHQVTALAIPLSGPSATAGASISPVSGNPEMRLRAEPADGVAPLSVTWNVHNPTGRQLVSYELDRTGGGSFDPAAASLAGSATTYIRPGLYFPTVRAVDADGGVHVSSTVVLVSDPTAVVAGFRAIWSSFTARLRAGDLAAALGFLAPPLRSRLEHVFVQLGADLPSIVAGLGTLQVTAQLGDLAEGVLVQSEPAGPALYFIQFRRDGLGRWLIEEM
jgi:hypothetical protein